MKNIALKIIENVDRCLRKSLLPVGSQFSQGAEHGAAGKPNFFQ
jgi:hypothetical protein